MSIDRCTVCADMVDTDVKLDCYGTDGKCRCEQCICQLEPTEYVRLYDADTYAAFERFLDEQQKDWANQQEQDDADQRTN